MTRIEVNHRAGLGSLLTILFSHLVKMPSDEPVSMFARSEFYAPVGVDMLSWFFATIPASEDAKLILNPEIDTDQYPFNTRLGFDKARLANFRRLRNRHFKLLPALPAKAREIIGPRRTLGVHYRGTDKYIEVPRIPFEDVCGRAERLAADHDAVFLATDEQAAAEYFSRRIPNVITNPHQRTNDVRGLHTIHGGRQQAEETMLDIHCLSLCDSLLLGRGNVADMACIFSNTDRFYYYGE